DTLFQLPRLLIADPVLGPGQEEGVHAPLPSGAWTPSSCPGPRTGSAVRSLGSWRTPRSSGPRKGQACDALSEGPTARRRRRSASAPTAPAVGLPDRHANALAGVEAPVRGRAGKVAGQARPDRSDGGHA